MTPYLSELRARIRAERRALSAKVRIASAERIAERVLSLPILPKRGYVAGYWAVDGEVSLHALLLRLPESLRYCLPVVQEDHVMRFAPWRPGEPLVTNRFGIPEPDVAAGDLLDAAQLDLVVVPLVAFDDDGHRIGMGGGWYDRAFAFRRHQPSPPLVGVAYSVQQVDRIAPQEWDVPMDIICTENDDIDVASRRSP